MAVHILIVDQDPDRRQRWVRSLEGAPDLDVAGAGEDLTKALLSASPNGRPDILLIAVDQPEMAHPISWAFLRTFLPTEVRIAAITQGTDEKILAATLAAGVYALLPIKVGPSTLRQTLRSIGRGQVAFHDDLMDRVKSLFLRSEDDTEVKDGGISIDPVGQTVHYRGESIDLTPLEFRLLLCLIRSKNRILSRNHLLRECWGSDFRTGGTDDQLRSCIKRLRMKIEPNPRRPRYILSRRGKGYLYQVCAE